MKTYHPILALWLFQLGAAQAVVYVDGSSKDWTPMAGIFDYVGDQGTGQESADIVGDDGSHPGFLVCFNDNGDVSSIDGTIGFRVRLDKAGGNNTPEYTRVLWIGIDADADNDHDLDLFLGVNMQGNAANDAIEIRDPGTDLNISPSTTSIGDVVTLNSTPLSYALTTSNYSYRPVNSLNDGGTLDDMTAGTLDDPDYYLSFMVPFGDIVNYLGSLPDPIIIDDTSPLRFVVATSTQVNRLNQDLGGIDGGVNSSETWENLGGMTQPYSPVPEPSGGLLLLGSLAAGCLRRRR